MGIFDRFPYSSTHEMNLDYMLGKATEIAEDMQTLTAGMEQVQAGLSAISEKTEQATEAAAQAAASASSIEGSVTAAEEAAEEAQTHNESAQTWANNALTYKADCQRAATEAAASSSSAAQAATAAAASEDTVATYAQAANASAQSAANNNDSAHQYANQASASASNATFHSSNAQTAATNAQTAATNANTSATNASASADRAATLKTDVETLHRMCVTAVDQAAEQAVAAANSAAQAAATKTDVENLVESLPEDFTDLNNTVNQLSDEIENITIEGYEKATEELVGTTTNNAYWDNSNKAITVNGWSYLTVACDAGEKVFISGTGSTGARLFYAIDSNNDIIYRYDSEQNVRINDYEYITPSGTVKIIVNAKNNQGAASVKRVTNNYVKGQHLGTEYNDDIWSITGDKFTNIIGLHSSGNGTVNFQTINYNGSLFKSQSDDVAPINIESVGYLGANHGYAFVYDITSTVHGFTESEIGNTFVNDDGTWVLICIKSENVFQVACRDSNNWWGLKRVGSVPTSFIFGGITANTENSSLSQLLPSVKNIEVSVTKNTSDVFEVLESYDIINPTNGIEWIVNHVGEATNNSVADNSEPVITIRNLYQFNAYGACTTTHNIKMLSNIKLEFASGTQSSCFNSTDKLCVPQLSGYGSYNTASEQVDFLRTLWENQAVPPSYYLQAENDFNNVMCIGIIGIERNAKIESSAGFYYTSKKMYPYAVQPSESASSGDTYSFITYRIPCKMYDRNAQIQWAGWTKIGDDYYLFVNTLVAMIASLKLPKEMYGRKVEIIHNYAVTPKNDYVVDTLDIVSTRQGQLLCKLTK